MHRDILKKKIKDIGTQISRVDFISIRENLTRRNAIIYEYLYVSFHLYFRQMRVGDRLKRFYLIIILYWFHFVVLYLYTMWV